MTPYELIDFTIASDHFDFDSKDRSQGKMFEYILSEDIIKLNDKDLILEFGVFLGATIALINKYTKDYTVYGFDSFEGLPEAWPDGSGGNIAEKGWLAMPEPPKNTDKNTYVVGLIEDTYPRFLEWYTTEKIQFVHVDVDLYKPAKTVFELSYPRLKSGTIIVVDDIYGYPGWELNCCKAFSEFLTDTNLKVQPVSSCGLRSNRWASVAYKVL